MKYLHYPLDGKKGKKVKVKFDRPCKVLLMDGILYSRYKKGLSFTAFGGFKENSPAIFRLPRDGQWHLIVEMGGYFKPERINASVELIN